MQTMQSSEYPIIMDNFDLLNIQIEIFETEKELDSCNKLINQGMTSDAYGNVFEKIRNLEARLVVLKEEYEIKQKLRED